MVLGLATQKRVNDLESKINDGMRKTIEWIKYLDKQTRINAENIKELQNSLRSEVRTEVRSKLLRSKTNYADEKIIKRFKDTKPDMIINAIGSLLDKGIRTIDAEDIIVKEKQLCGKSSFYKYLGLVRSEVRTPLRSKV